MNPASVAPLNVVLVEPEIPQNAGNIGRTCVGLGARLHFVGQLGFSLDDRDLKRAGLDYWPKLDWLRHPSWHDFLASVPKEADLALFSTHGHASFWERAYRTPCYLVFGSESRGFPPSFYERYADKLVRIPVRPDIRSLNLSTAVGIAAYEAARQNNIVPEKL
ncbi:MAG: tRNA (cytidine(34)-2'-O)-methyltransferase [Elusimicrobia bacterium]|nr:tRNA (cytidine(34)-2'-O)-methyltransferase [Elusimicrobiota bacterium]